MSKFISYVFLAIALGLSGLFVTQLYDAMTKDSRFLIFQIIFLFVWGIGASIFWVIGLSIFRSTKSKDKE